MNLLNLSLAPWKHAISILMRRRKRRSNVCRYGQVQPVRVNRAQWEEWMNEVKRRNVFATVLIMLHLIY